MGIAFLITSPYQVYHYKWIATHFAEATAILEVRDQDHGLSEAFVEEHMPNCELRRTPREKLSSLDGCYEVVVCQTPILPLEFLQRSYVVAQQYSLAKEQYQYGAWRAHAHLNLMYGSYSLEKVRGFSNAVAVGNPLLDPYFQQAPSSHRLSDVGAGAAPRRPRLLYMPTHGGLSTLRSVLAKLRTFDADITVKLHHAEPPGAADAGKGLRIVHSDADPVRLLREHDGVISDFSGAAFDAVYAGLPVVVTGTAELATSDVERLSAAERDRSLLAGLAEVWHGGPDLFERLSAAEQLLDSPAHKEFREAAFVNAGEAGAACAREIRRLIAQGEPEDFGVQQVRAATKRYIQANRELRASSPRRWHTALERFEVSGATSKCPTPPALRRVYRRSRRLLARSAVLRRVVRRLRRTGASIAPVVPRPAVVSSGSAVPRPAVVSSGSAVPAERREEVFQLLSPYLAEASILVARDTDETGCDVAIRGTAKRRLRLALRKLATQRPELRVRVGVDWRVIEVLPLNQLGLSDLACAHWLEIGTPHAATGYSIGFSGYLTVLFVEHDRDKNRCLALKKRARRIDWTTLFLATDARIAGPAGVAAVGSRPSHPAEPVDVVYTWVDAGDPEWSHRYQQYRHGHEVHNPSAANQERYIDREELRYSLRALWMFAPFVRNIYLVTADQRPAWLAADHPRVRVVSHSEIFPDPSMLPTFNSHAIETCLHRIPGLSEHFLYLNDDVFVGREVGAADFFTQTGLAKVRFSPSQYIYQGRPEPAAIPTDWAAYNATNLMQRDFGLTFDRRVQHVPLVQRRSGLAEIEQRYHDEVEATRRARFRAVTDLAVPSMLAQFYGIATGRAVEWPPTKNEYLYLDTGRRDSLDRFQDIHRHRPRFFCLNSTRHAEIPLAQQARNLRGFLAPAFPRPAPWER